MSVAEEEAVLRSLVRISTIYQYHSLPVGFSKKIARYIFFLFFEKKDKKLLQHHCRVSLTLRRKILEKTVK